MTVSPCKLILAHLAMAAANTILGVGSVVSKIGLNGMNPVVFALLRELFAAPLLFVMSLTLEGSSRNPAVENDADLPGGRSCPLTKLDALQFTVAGVMLFGTNFGYIVGVKILGATPAAIWQAATPIFTLLLSVTVGLERFSTLKIVGVALAFAGCAFVTLWHSDSSQVDELKGNGDQLVGNLIFFVQVTALAGFLVAEKPLLARWTPLATLAYSYAIASALMLIAALIINSTPWLLGSLCPYAALPRATRAQRAPPCLTQRCPALPSATPRQLPLPHDHIWESACSCPSRTPRCTQYPSASVARRSDCADNGWAVPKDAVLAVAYWVLMGSVTSCTLPRFPLLLRAALCMQRTPTRTNLESPLAALVHASTATRHGLAVSPTPRAREWQIF